MERVGAVRDNALREGTTSPTEDRLVTPGLGSMKLLSLAEWGPQTGVDPRTVLRRAVSRSCEVLVHADKWEVARHTAILNGGSLEPDGLGPVHGLWSGLQRIHPENIREMLRTGPPYVVRQLEHRAGSEEETRQLADKNSVDTYLLVRPKPVSLWDLLIAVPEVAAVPDPEKGATPSGGKSAKYSRRERRMLAIMGLLMRELAHRGEKLGSFESPTVSAIQRRLQNLLTPEDREGMVKAPENTPTPFKSMRDTLTDARDFARAKEDGGELPALNGPRRTVS